MRKVRKGKIVFDDELQLQFDFGSNSFCYSGLNPPMSDSERDRYERELEKTISNIVSLLNNVSI